MFVTGKEVLDRANSKGYAVGAFNIVNMEVLQAIISAADAEDSPVIIQTTEGAIKYAGLEYIFNMAKLAADSSKVPVVIHLDHGKNTELIKRCIDIGYSSVMIDASGVELEENIRKTKEIVELAHAKGVSVEAEIGTLSGVEDNVSIEKQDAMFTDPDQAEEFVKKTGIDSLAIAIGTSHGIHKFKGPTKLNFDILRKIKTRLGMPLVLHGASGIPKEIIEKAIKYGAEFTEAHGVDDESLKQAVAGGINKVNIDSDIRLSFSEKIRETLSNNKGIFDIRKILAPARDAMMELAQHKIRILGSSGKAWQS